MDDVLAFLPDLAEKLLSSTDCPATVCPDRWVLRCFPKYFPKNAGIVP
jgi:hypothetical protein